MKKKIILIFSIILIIILACFVTLYVIDNNRMKNNEPVLFSTWGKTYLPSKPEVNNDENINEEVEEKKEIEENIYVDENPVKLGIYIESGNTKKLITEYSCYWEPELVMNVFYAVPTQEETISNYSFDTLWKKYINSYPNPEKYRIGYNISFTLKSGEKVDKTILNPDDAYYMFPKVMCFLYDDVNLVPGKPYYHITQDVMYDYTICSSVKLVGDVETSNITSDIKLTAFCFDSDDDFDPETGKYRGNNFYSILIKRK